MENYTSFSDAISDRFTLESEFATGGGMSVLKSRRSCASNYVKKNSIVKIGKLVIATENDIASRIAAAFSLFSQSLAVDD